MKEKTALAIMISLQNVRKGLRMKTRRNCYSSIVVENATLAGIDFLLILVAEELPNVLFIGETHVIFFGHAQLYIILHRVCIDLQCTT